MTSSQAGLRARSLPVNVIMAYSTFIKATGCTGILHLLLLGILLPIVSGQTPSTSSMPSTLTTATAPTPVATTATPITGSAAASTPQPSTTATSGATSTPMTPSNSSMPTANSSSSSTSMMSTSQPSNSTGAMSGTNGTAASNSSSMSTIRCPSFTCNDTDCYTMYTSQNATSCSAGAYCQLIRQMDTYRVGCSASCVESCVNATHTNCSVNCCTSTGCLDGTFASMVTTATTVTDETTATPVTTTASSSTSPPTPASNGKKCHKGSCDATACYEDFRNQPLQTCSSSEPHCQLKKETVNSNLQWTAGCTSNCSGTTSCKAFTQPPCHLECCNATATSCLWLNGTLNVPSFATRGPRRNAELIATLLSLLAITLLP